MRRPLLTRYCAAAFLFIGSALLAGCQQGASSGATDLGVAGNSQGEPIRESELRAYCPPITLREGTAYFRTYDRGAEGDPDSIIYQASVGDVTRACNYGEGSVAMTIAVAGRVVPGPKGRVGNLTLPIRVAALRGDEVLYSQLFSHPVAIEDTSGATQFLFSDSNVVIPRGVDRSVRIIVGFDEGPTGAR